MTDPHHPGAPPLEEQAPRDVLEATTLEPDAEADQALEAAAAEPLATLGDRTPRPYGVSLDEYIEHQLRLRPLGVTPDAAAQAPPPIALPAQLGRVVELLERNRAVDTLPPGPFVLEALETARAALQRAEAVVAEFYNLEAERERVVALLGNLGLEGTIEAVDGAALLELLELLKARDREVDGSPVPALGRLQRAADALVPAIRMEAIGRGVISSEVERALSELEIALRDLSS